MSDGGDAELDIGGRLRTLRAAHGLSQRTLAKRAGVTNATISLIESGRMNPSVGALKRVLDGIPVSLTDFFAFEPGAERQVFFQAEELKEIGKGRISYRQVGGNLFGRRLQILHERYEPGADTGRAPLSHDGEEGGVVISGRLEVTVGDQRKILGPGDAYAFDSTEPHRFRAVGPEPCIVVSACTPPSF
ncbi:cupin domain-containing protein [Stappia indica]|uniref:cupin domain-containing protein n=1 Tax=Stappia indica TaxID=538381 RepID=UPI00083707FB|nr:cupin domain-containing protein [Stappia indica]MCC4246570.1 cupin domain-containing protein [Stappia indica]